MAMAKKAPLADAPEFVTNSVEAATKPLLSVHENVRAVTEKTIEQARTQYSSMKKAAEDASGTLESAFGALTSSMMAFNVQALEAMRANANATFDHLAKLQGVKSVAEAIELQATHARSQMETMTAQAKQFQELAQKATNDVVAPVKAALTTKR